MTQATRQVPADLLPKVRALLPKSIMTYGQARTVAEIQAGRVRKLLPRVSMRLPMDWIEQLPGVSVTLLTAAEMEVMTKRPDASGATDIRKDGTYRIYLNESKPPTHCRFTLCHELYHVITGPFQEDIFGDFGHGDKDLHNQRVERVADHFAANLLVPKRLLKQAWSLPIQDVRALAAQFFVSEDTIRIRLKTTGLIPSGLTKQMFYRFSGFRSRSGRPWPAARDTVSATPPTGTRWLLRQPRPVPLQEAEPATEHRETHRHGAVLTVPEACRELRISRWSLYQLINRRQLKTIQIGRRRLIPVASLHQLIATLTDQEGA